jgi:hypothetical protein
MNINRKNFQRMRDEVFRMRFQCLVSYLRMTFLLIGQNNMKLWVMCVCSLIGR